MYLPSPLWSATNLVRVGAYVGLSLVGLIAWWLVAPGGVPDLSVPLMYQGADALYSDMAVKTLLETGWFHANPWLGAPEGRGLHEFFQPYGVHYVTMRLLGLLTGGDWVLTLNLFILVSYTAILCSAFFLFRWLRLSPLLAGAAAIVFALLPYHAGRLALGHLFLSSYFIVPLALWLALRCAAGDPPRLRGRGAWGGVGVALLMSNCGIYYALFGCFAVLMGGVVGSVERRTATHLLAALGLIGICALAVLVTMLPSLLAMLASEATPFLDSRSAGQAEVYGLKLIQLFLPVAGHRLDAFAQLAYAYAQGAPLVNENAVSGLGVIGGMGLLVLLVFFFLRGPLSRISRHLEALALFNLGFLLLGTLGGFGSLLAWTVSPLIRGYNRVSIFIACLALAAAFLLLDALLRRLPRLPVATLVPALVLITGVLDLNPRVPISVPEEAARRFHSDRAFVAALEARLPAGARVFQTPHSGLPDSGPRYRAESYAQLRGYLHSRDLHWSYGAQVGSSQDAWLQALDSLPAAERVDTLERAGFAGIYVVRLAYRDHAAALERELGSILPDPPLESADGNLAFYRLSPNPNRLERPVYAPIPHLRLVSGFWGSNGPVGERVWTKGDADLAVEVIGGMAEPRALRLEFYLSSLVEREVCVYLGDRRLAKIHLGAGQGQPVSLPLPATESVLRLRLETDRPAVRPVDLDPASRDSRALAFFLDRIRLRGDTDEN